VCHCIVGVATLLGREGSRGCGLAGTALPGKEGSSDEIDYNNKDGRGRHKRGGADDDDKQRERSFNNSRQ
jgi:hypothetical protein